MILRRPHLAVLFACTFALSGCKVRELGAHISDTQAKHVDATWVKAAKGCWPMLNDKSDSFVSYNLADPIGFRNTFPAYAAMNDVQIEGMVAAPITDAPSADLTLFQNATAPLLTRQQALSDAANTSDSRDAKTISPETLCIKRSGTPAEYR